MDEQAGLNSSPKEGHIRGKPARMRRHLNVIMAALLIFFGAAISPNELIAADGPRRIALVIGNARYENVPRLANPANDARLIASTLRDLGFELIGDAAQLDLDRVAMEKVIRDFSYRLSPGSVGFFYYSGHGIQLRGTNFLVPVGANPTTARDADFELVDANLLLRQMEDSGTSLNVVVLDACRNNPFGGRGLKDVGAGLAQMQAPRGTIVAYSTQPGGVAADGDGTNSPYTTALARLMKRPGLGILDMFNQVAVTVDSATNHAQQPWTALSPITQDFYLAGMHTEVAPGPVPSTPSVGTLPPVPQTTPPTSGTAEQEVVFWQSVQNTRSVVELEAYLRRYPDGLFAELARARIAALELPVTTGPSQNRQTPGTPQNGQQQALANTPPLASTAIANASDPAKIAEAQRLLSTMSLVPGESDGRLGPHTRQAVRAFQIAANIPDDGEVSDTLLAQLHAPPPTAQARAGALAKLAEEAAHDGSVPDAIRLYTASVHLYPANAMALIALGDLQRSTGNLEDARRSFSQAAQLGGATSSESQHRLASLPHTTSLAPNAVGTPGLPRIPPIQQTNGAPASLAVPDPTKTMPDPNISNKVWVVTAIMVGGGSATAKDQSKDAAEKQALLLCQQHGAPMSANAVARCLISSEVEQDITQ